MTDKQSNRKTCQLASSMAIEPEYVKLLIITKRMTMKYIKNIPPDVLFPKYSHCIWY